MGKEDNTLIIGAYAHLRVRKTIKRTDLNFGPWVLCHLLALCVQ